MFYFKNYEDLYKLAGTTSGELSVPGDTINQLVDKKTDLCSEKKLLEEAKSQAEGVEEVQMLKNRIADIAKDEHYVNRYLDVVKSEIKEIRDQVQSGNKTAALERLLNASDVLNELVTNLR